MYPVVLAFEHELGLQDPNASYDMTQKQKAQTWDNQPPHPVRNSWALQKDKSLPIFEYLDEFYQPQQSNNFKYSDELENYADVLYRIV